jgi:hypothetical protein
MVATDVSVWKTTRQTFPMTKYRRHIDVAMAHASNPLGKWQKAK